MYNFIWFSIYKVKSFFSEDPTNADSKTSNTDELFSGSTLKQSENVEVKEVCSRTHLLLSLNQMIIHSYPLPTFNHQLSTDSDGFRFTNNHYLPVTDKSPMFAVDCEMCYTTIGKNELTRVSIINEQLKVRFFKIYKYNLTLLHF